MKSNNNWPAEKYHELVNFYGKVGQNQTKLTTPYPLKLAWKPEITVRRITCHERVADSMDRVLRNILYHYGSDGIQQLKLDLWGGCLNVRKKRGGTTYSMHSWGIANDWDPLSNQLRTPWAQCSFSKPVYIDFLNAWILEGWNPLGLSWGRDSMHIQATDNSVRLLSTNTLLRHA